MTFVRDNSSVSAVSIGTNGSRALYHKQMCQSQIYLGGYPTAAISRVSDGKRQVPKESSGILPGQAASEVAAALARRTQRQHYRDAPAKAPIVHDHVDAILRSSSMQMSTRAGSPAGSSPMGKSRSTQGDDRQRFVAQMCGGSPIGLTTNPGSDPHCGSLPRRGRSASPPSSHRIFPADSYRGASPRRSSPSPGADVRRLRSSPSPSRTDPLLCNAQQKLEEWKSFKQMHKRDLQKVLAGAAGGSWQAGDDAARENVTGLANGAGPDTAARKLTRKEEAIFVSANCSSNVAPERRRDYNCPIRTSAALGGGLASKKDQLRNCVHPITPVPVDPLLSKTGSVSRRSLGSQRDRAPLPPRGVLGERGRQR